MTEEDVKDAYVRALGLKQYSKNLVDIRAEMNALAFVREPAKFVKLDASFTT